MLINNTDRNTTEHVEFVSYTGKWPHLCSGILTLRIDNEEIRFGYDEHGSASNEKFWRTGGECSLEAIHTGEWLIDVSKIPEQYRKYAAEIDTVFNENVEYGCCGGCR